MKLSKLLEMAGIEVPDTVFIKDPEIGSVHCRSQSVRPGGLFVAVCGLAADGHRFIDDAVARGAAAVVVERPVDTGAPQVLVKDSRRALARISSAFYGAPSTALCLVGITGTNGKTTVTYLVERMLLAAGKAPGVIGSIAYRYAGQVFDAPVTTPESLDLQRILAEMRQNGLSHAVMEVSSHGIDLSRVAGCAFDVAAFTNLTRDHLDYHGTLDAYWNCKKRLFTEYLAEGPKRDRAVAVVNTDNTRGRELAGLIAGSQPGRRVLSYGVKMDSSDVRAVDCIWDAAGIRGGIVTPEGAFLFRSNLVGRFNLENILCAAAIGYALQLPLPAIRDGIMSLQRVPGRLEPVENRSDRYVFVDYAHTPDALENVLTALCEVKRGKLICIFGCGGDRDRGKRPLMGRIAATRSDLSVVTSDNPRTEDPDAIITEILSGIPQELAPLMSARDFSAAGQRRKAVVAIADRAAAIALGLRMADPGDMVLIAGKGHETYQILGRQKVPFDDRTAAAAVLAELNPVDGGGGK
jgi:UDP-N-acetylmuramoyl-L-alanyl-D-glutamate--2,6-diaminopimelate ligase